MKDNKSTIDDRVKEVGSMKIQEKLRKLVLDINDFDCYYSRLYEGHVNLEVSEDTRISGSGGLSCLDLGYLTNSEIERYNAYDREKHDEAVRELERIGKENSNVNDLSKFMNENSEALNPFNLIYSGFGSLPVEFKEGIMLRDPYLTGSGFFSIPRCKVFSYLADKINAKIQEVFPGTHYHKKDHFVLWDLSVDKLLEEK